MLWMCKRCVCGSSGKGFFMHFSTASAEPADRATLETQWLYPKSGAQCLQFFLYRSGASDDVLNIWVREYDKAHGSRLTLFRTITGIMWALYRCEVFSNKENQKYVCVHSHSSGL